MPLLLAYAFDKPADPRTIESRLERVRAHYESSAQAKWVRQGWADPRVGVLLWDFAKSKCRWPFWAEAGQQGVATSYIPFGSSRVVPAGRTAGDALALAQRLTRDPALISEIDPPLVLAAIDRSAQSLTLMTDGLGYGRLYEMAIDSEGGEGENGWVWSNFLGALPLFAGVAPHINREGWSYLAATGWFMDNDTSIHGTRQLGPGTFIEVKAGASLQRAPRDVNAIEGWVRPRTTTPGVTVEAVESVRDHLLHVSRSLAGLWPAPPLVHLSGGRDSRAVAAAVITSGIQAAFYTRDNLQGEVTTVQQLFAKLASAGGRLLDHSISRLGAGRTENESLDEPADDSPNEPREVDLRSRVEMHHMLMDAMASPNVLGEAAPSWEKPVIRAHLSGAGGELAHGHYYPLLSTPARLPMLQRLADFIRGNRLDPAKLNSVTAASLAKRIGQKITTHGGATREALGQARARIQAVLDEGSSHGLHGLNLADYFYLLERLRRWNNSSLRPMSITPLVNFAFIRATFDLSPQDRYANAFPRALIASMIPAWADIPFYRTMREDQQTSRRPRIWASRDADQYEQIIHDDETWHDVFDASAVRQMWRRARAGDGEPKHEVVFRRVAWRACFEQHLKRLSETATHPPELGVRASLQNAQTSARC